MAQHPSSVQVGMVVLGADKESVGLVKQVNHTDFLLDRELERDIYIPWELIAQVENKLVVLSITAEEVNTREWPKPPI
jgi:hypothetical protein